MPIRVVGKDRSSAKMMTHQVDKNTNPADRNVGLTYLKRGLVVGLPLALACGSLWGLSLGLSTLELRDAIRLQAKSQVQASLEVVTGAVRAELHSVVQHARETVTQKLDPQREQSWMPEGAARGPAAVTQPQGWAFVEMQPDFLDVSVWMARGKPAQVPQRIQVGMNSRFSDPSAQWADRLMRVEENERQLVQVAMMGHRVAASEPLADGGTFLFLAFPDERRGSAPARILTTHIRLERFQHAFKRIGDTGLLEGAPQMLAFLDSAGNVLGHPDFRHVLRRESWFKSALFQEARRSPASHGVVSVHDNQDRDWLLGFEKLSFGSLYVLVAHDVQLVMSRIPEPWIQGLAVFLLVLGTTLIIQWIRAEGWPAAVGRRIPTSLRVRWVDFKATISEVATQIVGIGWDMGHKDAPEGALAGPEVQWTPAATKEEKPVTPEVQKIAVIHGSFRRMQQWIADRGSEITAEALNEFFTVAAHRIESFGGRFERHAGHSFVGIFGLSDRDGAEIWKALRCCVELRKDFGHLNSSRGTDGEKPILYGVGVHWGEGLVAKLGPSDRKQLTAVGEVATYARALDQLSSSVGQDILVSQEAWQASGGKFMGEQLGEEKLTPDTGLMAFFKLTGYLDESGRRIEVQPAVDSSRESATRETRLMPGEPGARRWFANNGNQILGPLSVRELSQMLHSQEIDFDSECWPEGSGQRSEIRSAGVFSGSDDEGARYWVYDGSTIHGALSEGFIKTAIQHGALKPESCSICEASTAAGWSSLAEWVTSRLAKARSPEAAAGPAGSSQVA